MELFKYLLFGISGLSIIFWVAVIAIWHTYMFPRFFNEDYQNKNFPLGENSYSGYRLKPSGLIDRGKYSLKSFVLADFSPLEPGYRVNRLYTTMLLSLGVMSFILISYGLHSGFAQFVYPS